MGVRMIIIYELTLLNICLFCLVCRGATLVFAVALFISSVSQIFALETLISLGRDSILGLFCAVTTQSI